ncbi:MAG: ribose 5-phosphate isomerase B [Imperialibacter sp.]|uniref:ribose 5-phosphate isomerase B n=1 Tax=Imperialibacter sp. TaxID=2038411 RepID=UPI0032ED1737
MSLKIALGADHAGFGYKEKILSFLQREGHVVKDFGTHSADSIDYADFAHPVATSVESHESDFGILICGSGNGVAMTANKHQQIRAALCWKEELAALARQHNNANVLCMPERFVDYEEAEKMVRAFLSVEFEGGRHERRVGKISC